MPTYTLTSNMALILPTVGSDPGPDYATHLNASLSIIDAHDHTSGNGVKITPSGLNINTDLSIGSNNLTSIRSSRFISNAAVLALGTDLNCVNVVNGDLYFNDGSGNKVRITQAGGVAGSPGSIGSLTAPASATYVAANTKFVWQADANKYAAMDNGAVTIRETNVASANGITIQSPSSLAAAYSLTLLTALPGSTQWLSCDSSGNLGTVSSNTIQQGVTRANGTTVGLLGVAISASSGVFNSTTAVYADITNLSVTITVSGARPIFVGMVPADTPGAVGGNITLSASTAQARVRVLRDGTNFSADSTVLNGGGSTAIPCGSVFWIDTGAAAGARTYKLQLMNASGAGTATVNTSRLVVYEI